MEVSFYNSKGFAHFFFATLIESKVILARLPRPLKNALAQIGHGIAAINHLSTMIHHTHSDRNMDTGARSHKSHWPFNWRSYFLRAIKHWTGSMVANFGQIHDCKYDWSLVRETESDDNQMHSMKNIRAWNIKTSGSRFLASYQIDLRASHIHLYSVDNFMHFWGSHRSPFHATNAARQKSIHNPQAAGLALGLVIASLISISAIKSLCHYR